MKLSELRTRADVLEEHLRDADFRVHWERTALARAVALRVTAYRVEHGLSQTALAMTLGMKQPAVARLEAGEKNPTWDTLTRLSRCLSIEFLVDIAPKGRPTMAAGITDGAGIIERSTTGETDVLVVVR